MQGACFRSKCRAGSSCLRWGSARREGDSGLRGLGVRIEVVWFVRPPFEWIGMGLPLPLPARDHEFGDRPGDLRQWAGILPALASERQRQTRPLRYHDQARMKNGWSWGSSVSWRWGLMKSAPRLSASKSQVCILPKSRMYIYIPKSRRTQKFRSL